MKKIFDCIKKMGPASAFFLTLGLIGIISFILPLHPTVSFTEKRELAAFPQYSAEDLLSGKYFDGISTWYSDTFPGREGWMEASRAVASLHGYGDIAIQGDLPAQAAAVPAVPAIPAPTRPPETGSTEAPAELPDEPTVESEPLSIEEDDVNLDVIIGGNAIVQVRDFAFYAVDFSQAQSDRYARTVSQFADSVAEQGVRVISAPPPTAITVLADQELLAMMNCAAQPDILGYIHGSMSENVLTVDTCSAVLAHPKEYLYFHSDHHWTALAAYYAYCAVCETLGLEPVPLEEMEMRDMGEFQGSMYGRVQQMQRLGKDYVHVYVPKGDIHLNVCEGYSEYETPLFRQMTEYEVSSKYSTFLSGDRPLVHLVNNDIPEGRKLVIIKDSFGNCFVPYFAQHYHDVYAIDYRKFGGGSFRYFIGYYGIDDVIFAPNMMSTQATDGVSLIAAKCG